MKFKIELDTYLDFDDSGDEPSVTFVAFVGDAEEASFTKTVSMNEMIDNWIENNSIPDGTMSQNHREDAKRPLLQLAELIKAKLDKIDQVPAWKSYNNTESMRDWMI